MSQETLDFETLIAIQGINAKATLAHHELARSRVLTRDLKRAEALARTQPTNDLERGKVLLSRGKLSEAKKLFENVDENSPSNIDPLETQFEKLRLLALESQWQDVIILANRLLTEEISPVTRISTFQTRALAHFETSDFKRALHDIEQVEILSEIFPAGPSVFYAKTLKCKIELRLDDSLTDKKAKSILSRFQKELPQPLSSDFLLTYLRLKSEAERLSHQDPMRSAAGAWILASLMGDELYASLALAELCLEIHPLIPPLQKLLEEQTTRYPRVAYTLKTLKPVFARKPDLSADEVLGLIKKENQPTHLWLKDENWLLRLSPFEPISTDLPKRIVETLTVLTRQEATEEEIFKESYPKLRFDSAQHSAGIRSLLSRMRTQLGLKIFTHEGKVNLEGVFKC